MIPRWWTVANGPHWHVIPLDDDKPHRVSVDCPCCPKERDPNLFVHPAWDHREVLEEIPMTIDEHFRSAGTRELMAAPDAALHARVNPLDKFVLWAAPYINSGIVGAFHMEVQGHVEWFNAYCASCYSRPDDDGYRDHRPTNSPLVREIATAAYNQLRQEPL